VTLFLAWALPGLLAACAASTGHASARTGALPALPRFRSVGSAPPVSPPARVQVPSIGVDATVAPVGTAPDGTVEVPKRWEQVGWFRDGPSPGEPGPAVLLGHVDSKSGPAVFYRLRALAPGAPVVVQRSDGSVVRFRVTRVARYPKRRFPTADVYLPTLRPELRLVTCGGSFDFRTGHYVDNVIAYAVLSAGSP
jgi:hypothetical protein